MSSKPTRRQYLANQLLLGILLVSISAIILVGSIDLYLEYRNTHALIEHQVADYARSAAVALRDSRWALDDERTTHILQGLIATRHIEYAAISQDGLILAEVGTPGTANYREHQSELRHVHRGTVIEPGTLTVHSDTSHVVEHVFDQAAISVIAIVAQLFLMGAVVNWLVRHKILRHLETIAEHARLIHSGHLGQALELNRSPTEHLDELSDVVNAINEMTARIHDANLSLEMAVNERNDALERSNKELSEAQSLARIGNFSWTQQTGEMQWSEQLYRVFRMNPRFARPSLRTLLPCVHPEDRNDLLDAIRGLEHGQGPIAVEFRIIDSSGTVRHLSALSVTERSDKGYLSVRGTVQDITRVRESDAKLRQAAAVVEATSEGIMITDPDLRITSVNPAFETITGYLAQDVIGRTPAILKSGRHDDAFYVALWASLRDTGQWQGEIWNRRANGEIYPEWLNISTVYNGNSVGHYVAVFTDITSLRKSQERLNYLAHHDPLTDLPNRLSFMDNLEKAIHRAQRSGKALGLLFIDLDRFKEINDTLGHPAGDTLLREAAERIQSILRASDSVARLGGDEFTVILEGLNDAGDAALVADKILKLLLKPFEISGQTRVVSCSIGISTYPSDGDDAITLLRNADSAMYRAKEEGRNRFRFYTRELTDSALERIQVEHALRRAIENGSLEVHYQPQWRISDQNIIGVEALIRLTDPELGAVSAQTMGTVAESTGLSGELTAYVLNRACADISSLHTENGDPLGLAINISALDLDDGDLLSHIRYCVTRSGFHPERLELEITENALMRQPDRVIEELALIKQEGYRLAVDDFGTGYSSMNYIKRFPVNRIKIDRSFIKDIPADRHDEVISRAIIALAHSLGMDVLAEGVETPAQRSFLADEGCDNAQGFLVSRALPITELRAFLGEVVAPIHLLKGRDD